MYIARQINRLDQILLNSFIKSWHSNSGILSKEHKLKETDVEVTKECKENTKHIIGIEADKNIEKVKAESENTNRTRKQVGNLSAILLIDIT